MDEADLIAGCQRGDRAAQREVYDRHVDRVYRVALRLTRNDQDAFDVAQETFVRAFERMDRFDQRARLGTWLYRIVTNEALQLFRRRATERRHLRAVSEQQEYAVPPESQTTRLEVEDAMERLSEEHQAILILRYQEGLSYDDLAEVLEIASGTVASRLNRAREALRVLLEGATPELEESTSNEHLIGDVTNPQPDVPRAG